MPETRGGIGGDELVDDSLVLTDHWRVESVRWDRAAQGHLRTVRHRTAISSVTVVPSEVRPARENHPTLYLAPLMAFGRRWSLR